jgi:putative membrane protein
MTTRRWTTPHSTLVGALAVLLLANLEGAVLGAPRDTVAASDLRALQKLHDSNQREIDMGHLAQDRGGSREMKTFGRRLVSDHTLADQKIGEYLKKRGLALTDLATMAGADEPYGRISGAGGAEFDHAFAVQTVDDHRKTIDLVERARRTTLDEDLRTFYDQLLPTLQAHKKAAEALAEGGRALV